MPTFALTVNGAQRTVDVAADTPLIYILRGNLQLTGTRLGCGMAQCGACAVLADGKEIRSCVTPVSLVGARKIHTIEGLPAFWTARMASAPSGAAVVAQVAGVLHPIQQAWIEEQVPQCGYCQSGMMIAAADLLGRIPNPTVGQIKEAFTATPPSPHLCRCGTYNTIVTAIQRAAKLMNA
jgi:aerobic-type carbon monoxide dehydrogenase small subunit (CoxS/CutS family)